MTSVFAKYRVAVFITIFSLAYELGNAQERTEKWRAQFTLGINNPIDDGKNDGYYTKYVNFPSINLGIQHMFSDKLGAKLDYGFNRSENDSGSKPFKLNYSRINFQLVYDATKDLRFLPEPLKVVAHAGPGISFTKPLGNDTENKYTFLNALAGLEIHYKLSRGLSVFTDVSFAYSLSGKDKYDSDFDGFSFNGNLLYASVGISVALSGCNYCK